MVCEQLGINPAEAAAFGDNYNDLAMLDLVGTPYIMESSSEELRKRFSRHIADPAAEMRRIAARARAWKTTGC